MQCNKCNHILPDDSKFCQYCGNKIEDGFVISKNILDTTEVTVIEHTTGDITKKDETNFDSFSTKKSINSSNKSKKIKILLALLITLPIVLIIVILSINYFTAYKKAENAVAIYLSKENDDNYYYDDFTSFKKTYHTIKFSNFKYTVELSGAAYMGLKNNTTSFNAKVEINPLTGNTSIRKLTYNNKRIKK